MSLRTARLLYWFTRVSVTRTNYYEPLILCVKGSVVLDGINLLF